MTFKMTTIWPIQLQKKLNVNRQQNTHFKLHQFSYNVTKSDQNNTMALLLLYLL